MESFIASFENPANINSQFRAAMESKPQNYYEKNKDYDLSQYISPYFVNPFQKEMLKHVLGNQNINEMMTLNTLIYAGIINSGCPPRENGELVESYVDPLTGKTQCTRPNMWGQQISKAAMDKKCPPLHNPYAIEKYIDHLGQAQCRQPVRIGATQCPPPPIRDENGRIIDTQFTKTKHVTLPDGVGICVDEDTILSPGFASSSILSSNNPLVSSKFNNYINIFSEVGMDANRVKSLNKLLKSADLSNFQDKVLNNPKLYWMEKIVKNINNKEDMNIANLALYEAYGGAKNIKGGAKRRKNRRKSKKNKRKSKKNRH